MVSLFIFQTGPTPLDSEPRGRRYAKNTGHNRNRLYSRAIHSPTSMEMHYVQWFLLKSMYEITDCAKIRFSLLESGRTKPWCPGWDTKPGHHSLVRLDSRRQNLIFFTNHNILHTLKNEPFNIMLLHTSRRMDGPWMMTVPVVSHIFDVSSSMGLEIGGYLTSCVSYFLRISFHGARNRGLSYLLERWIRNPHPMNESSKYAPTDLGTKAQNMHQLRVLGAK